MVVVVVVVVVVVGGSVSGSAGTKVGRVGKKPTVAGARVAAASSATDRAVSGWCWPHSTLHIQQPNYAQYDHQLSAIDEARQGCWGDLMGYNCSCSSFIKRNTHSKSASTANEWKLCE